MSMTSQQNLRISIKFSNFRKIVEHFRISMKVSKYNKVVLKIPNQFIGKK